MDEELRNLSQKVDVLADRVVRLTQVIEQNDLDLFEDYLVPEGERGELDKRNWTAKVNEILKRKACFFNGARTKIKSARTLGYMAAHILRHKSIVDAGRSNSGVRQRYRWTVVWSTEHWPGTDGSISTLRSAIVKGHAKLLLQILFSTRNEKGVTHGVFEDWLSVRRSGLNTPSDDSAGLGLFAERRFEKRNVVSVYLGRIYRYRRSIQELTGVDLGANDYSMRYQHDDDMDKFSVLSAEGLFSGGTQLPELYLGAHFANDPGISEKPGKVNCKFNPDMTMTMTSKIEKNKEIFVAYGRDEDPQITDDTGAEDRQAKKVKVDLYDSDYASDSSFEEDTEGKGGKEGEEKEDEGEEEDEQDEEDDKDEEEEEEQKEPSPKKKKSKRGRSRTARNPQSDEEEEESPRGKKRAGSGRRRRRLGDRK